MLVRRDDIELQERYYHEALLKNIFIHPTDTHYCIGCDATNSSLVLKLRLLKSWQSMPFTVIAPSKEWIRENLEIPEQGLRQLPGPVTIIARLKNKSCVSEDVTLGTRILHVRIPDHWISKVIGNINRPFVSTVANKKSEVLMTSLDDADPHLVKSSGLVLHEGPKEGKPMVFIDYTAPLISQ